MVIKEKTKIELLEERISALTTAIDFLKHFEEDEIQKDVKILRAMRGTFVSTLKLKEEEELTTILGVTGCNSFSCVIEKEKLGLTIKIFKNEDNSLIKEFYKKGYNITAAKMKVRNYVYKEYAFRNSWSWKG